MDDVFDILEVWHYQWWCQGQNIKAKASAFKAKAWTFEAKPIVPKAKAFKHMTRAETKVHSRPTSDNLTG